MLFWRKKAIFSGKTKFQKIVRKIETNALTLKFSPHSEKLFAIAFTCVKTLFLAVGVETPRSTAWTGKIFTSIFLFHRKKTVLVPQK